MEIKKKIADIILTPGISNITRIVRIYKELEKDLSELAVILDMPQEILAKELEIKPCEDHKEKPVIQSSFKEYVKVFFEGYQQGSEGRKFKALTKDFSQIKTLMKLISIEELKKIMDLYVKIKNDISIKKKVEFEMVNFAKHISPGYIVSKINLLLDKIEEGNKPGKEINYERIKL